jgi:hypothetical protein
MIHGASPNSLSTGPHGRRLQGPPLRRGHKGSPER